MGKKSGENPVQIRCGGVLEGSLSQAFFLGRVEWEENNP